MNGYSLIYFVLYVFTQPRLGNILYKVIIFWKGRIGLANHKMSWSEPRNLKIIFFLPCKIKEAIVGKTFTDRACRTILTCCSHFKVPQVQSENLIIMIMYQIIHPAPSFDTFVIFIFDIVKRSNIPHDNQSTGI